MKNTVKQLNKEIIALGKKHTSIIVRAYDKACEQRAKVFHDTIAEIDERYQNEYVRFEKEYEKQMIDFDKKIQALYNERKIVLTKE